MPNQSIIRSVRGLRRFAWVVGPALWLCWRSSRVEGASLSLLQILVNTLETLREKLLDYCYYDDSHNNHNSSNAWTEWFLPLLRPLLFWGSILIQDVLAMAAVLAACRIVYCLWHYRINVEWKQIVVQRILYKAIMDSIPWAQRALDQEASAFAEETLRQQRKDNRSITTVLPDKPRLQADILQELSQHARIEDQRWMAGKVSGAVYYIKEEDKSEREPYHDKNQQNQQQLQQSQVDQPTFMSAVYAIYCTANPLHADFWPKVNQCEAEVVAMCGHLMHAAGAAATRATSKNTDKAAAAAQLISPPFGCLTSGGTESILLAIRAHFNYYGKRRGIHQHAELVCASTAHAAVWKACDIYNIRPVVVDCSQYPYQLTAQAVARVITSNTIMIYASAPCYPQGVVDDIGTLSDLARSYDIGLHVDACLGGFVLAFDDTAPVFDFRNAGVTSMSLDTHKYGYAAKGTSVVLYASNKLRHAQYFSYASWSGGLYATPTLAGSRPGALSVCAWAAMLSLGQEGYRTRVQSITATVRTICQGIAKIPGLKLMTPTGHQFMVACFGSDELDIYSIKDAIKKKGGWELNDLQNPAAVHLTVTMPVAGRGEEFLRDLQAAVKIVRDETIKQGNNKVKKQGSAGIYGTVSKVPSGSVEHLLNVFIDTTLTP